MKQLFNNFKSIIDSIQSWVESFLEKDKLEHFFIMSIILIPIGLFHIWWLKLLCALLIGVIKEIIDLKIRKTKWDWLDIFYGGLAGII